jgi:hypothetical protein
LLGDLEAGCCSIYGVARALSIFRDYLVKPHHTGAGLGSCKLSLALLLLYLLYLHHLHHLLILPVDKREDRLAVKRVVRLVIINALPDF